MTRITCEKLPNNYVAWIDSSIMAVPIVLSASPDNFSHAESLTDGIEAKLDWKHTEFLSRDGTLSDECDVQDVPPESITSIHLSPGTSQPQGLSVAPGNVGDITDFVHSAFGERVDPRWLTVHTTRTFNYRDHVERLATITEMVAIHSPSRTHLTPRTTTLPRISRCWLFSLSRSLDSMTCRY